MATISSAWLAASVAAIVFNIVFPLVLAVVVVRRLGERWRFVWYGALIFVLFQLVTRVPLVTVAQTLLGPVLQQSAAARWTWLFVLALTAGLFEEWGRYIGYRWLLRRDNKTWAQGVLYGVGHGGIEAVLLVGALSILTLVNVVVLSRRDLATLGLPAAQQQAVAQQLAAIAAQPWWYPLLGAWERIWAICFHVAMSLVVLQVFWRGERRWLWYAVGAHFLFNFVAVGLLQLGANQVAVEGLIALMGLLALWIVFRLRRTPSAATGVSMPVNVSTT